MILLDTDHTTYLKQPPAKELRLRQSSIASFQLGQE